MKKENVLISFLFPLYEENLLLYDGIKSIIDQKSSNEWEILIVDGSEGRGIPIEICELAKDDARVSLLKIEKHYNRVDCIDYGIAKVKGRWISVIENDYVFSEGAICKIERLLSQVDKINEKVGYISLWYHRLRINYRDSDSLKSEITHFMSRQEEARYTYNLVELTEQNFKMYGGFGIMLKPRASLISKEAYQCVRGYCDIKESPLEDRFLVEKMKYKGYATYLSIVPYGFLVNMGCIFSNKEEVLSAYQVWYEYKLSNTKGKRRSVLEYKLISSLIARHRSMNLTYEDFGYDLQKRPREKSYIFYFVMKNHFYQKWVNKQFELNDRIIKEE